MTHSLADIEWLILPGGVERPVSCRRGDERTDRPSQSDCRRDVGVRLPRGRRAADVGILPSHPFAPGRMELRRDRLDHGSGRAIPAESRRRSSGSRQGRSRAGTHKSSCAISPAARASRRSTTSPPPSPGGRPTDRLTAISAPSSPRAGPDNSGFHGGGASCRENPIEIGRRPRQDRQAYDLGRRVGVRRADRRLDLGIQFGPRLDEQQDFRFLDEFSLPDITTGDRNALHARGELPRDEGFRLALASSAPPTVVCTTTQSLKLESSSIRQPACKRARTAPPIFFTTSKPFGSWPTPTTRRALPRSKTPAPAKSPAP